MSAMQIRSFTPELEVSVKGSKREIEGIAVPYFRPVKIYEGLTEQFEPAVVEHQRSAMHRIKASHEHALLGGVLVGHTIHMEDTAEGLFWRSKIAKTRDGDDVLGLVEAGSLEHLSVGFREPIRSRRLAGPNGEVITSRVRVDLYEVAFTREGAYGELATIGGVRSIVIPGQAPADVLTGEEDVTEEYARREQYRSRLAEIQAELEDMRRRTAAWS